MKLHLCDLVIVNIFFSVHAQGLRRAQISASCEGPAFGSLTMYTTKHGCKLLLIDYLPASSDVIDYFPVFDDMLPSNHPIASPNFCYVSRRRSTLQSTRFPMPFSFYLFPMPLFPFCCLLPRTVRQLTTTVCVWYRVLSPLRTATKHPMYQRMKIISYKHL